MCFVCDHGECCLEDYKVQFNETALQKAKEDICVFKIVRKEDDSDSVKSYFFKKTYRVGETYTSVVMGVGFCVEKGLHSYNPKKVEIRKDDNGLCMVNEFGKLFTSYPNSVSKLIGGGYIMRCVIPKGARYITNKNGEMVSNKLKVISFGKIDMDSLAYF